MSSSKNSSKKRSHPLAINPSQLTPITQENKKQKKLINFHQAFSLARRTQSKDTSKLPPVDDRARNILWSESFSPANPSELAIHPKKLELIHAWLKDATYGPDHRRKYRRLLVLSGPAGCGKSAILHSFSAKPIDSNSSDLPAPQPSQARGSKTAPSRSHIQTPAPLQGIGYEILEWRNTGNESSSSKPQEFSVWLMRASAGPMLSFKEEEQDDPTHLGTRSASANKEEKNRGSREREPQAKSIDPLPRVLLVDDLPNLYHPETLKLFVNSLRFHLNSSRPSSPPLVVIVTDTTLKTGENGLDETLLNGHQSQYGSIPSQLKPLNVHTFLPLDVLNHPACCLVKLLAVNKTLMKKTLHRILDGPINLTSASSSRPRARKLSPAHMDLVINCSAGDLRAALNNLQQVLFGSESLGTLQLKSKTHTNLNHPNSRLLTYRDESLVIFHGLGKVLYNKRWGDDPVDDAKDQRVRGALLDKLPHFWAHFERRLAKNDADSLYSEVSVPAQQFLIYLHQNYPQFFNSIEETEFWLDHLSLADSSSLYLRDSNRYNPTGMSEYYQFQASVRSIGLSLPSPVARRSQKFFKPVLWDHFRAVNATATMLESYRDGRRTLGAGSAGGGHPAGAVHDGHPRPAQSSSRFDADDGASVIHSPRTLLAIEVLPFLGLISRFRGTLSSKDGRNQPYHPNKRDEEGEILAQLTTFKYPKPSQIQEINEDEDGYQEDEDDQKTEEEDEEEEEESLMSGSKGREWDDADRQKMSLTNTRMIDHGPALGTGGRAEEKDDDLWFEEEDDIVDD